MPAVILQFVFRPNPGAQLAQVIQDVKDAAAIWRKHGAELHLYSIQLGSIGNMAVLVHFPSEEQAGKTLQAVNTDPAFMAWRARNLASGVSSWVQSNQLWEIPLT